MNKFEQVSSDDHQMSLAGTFPRSDLQMGVTPCNVTYSMNHVIVPTHPPPTKGMTDICENITFLELLAVNIQFITISQK